jgi:hypothetical protein
MWLLAALLLAQLAGLVPAVPAAFLMYGTLLLWGGHILSPIVTAWVNPAFRPVLLKERGRFIGLPLLVLVGSMALGTLGNPLFLLFLTFAVWNTWHLGGQHFGVLSIYRHTGRRTSSRDRSLDRYFTVVCCCVLLPLAWFARRAVDRLGPLVSWAGPLPVDGILPTVIVAVAALLTLAYAGRELLVERGSLPRAVYIVSIGFQPVFAIVAGAAYSFTLTSITHWIVALALSARIISNQTNTGIADSPSSSSPWLLVRRLATSYAALIGVLVVLSIVVHVLVLRPAAGLSDFDYAVYFGYRLGDPPPALALLSGAYFGINFVHFLYDRYIYSFRRSEVRAAIVPHLFAPRT